MKVALTGAAGFIGRHVLAELRHRGIAPIALGRREPPGGGAFVRLDLREAGADTFERLGRPDVLIHLAWGGLPNYRSLHHFEEELPAHYRFLAGLARSGLQHLVVAGTCYEYGMVDGRLAEEREPAPANPYAYAKDALRRQLDYLRASHPFALTWARLFYVFGEGQAAGSLYSQLCQAVARGDREFPMSGGEQLRDYLPVAAAAGHLVDLALAGGHVGVVNVCSGQPVSVRRLVEGWIAGQGWSIEPELGRLPYPEHEPMAFWGDRRRLDSIAGRTESAGLDPEYRSN